MRKRKTTYPPAKTATKRAPAPAPDPDYERPNLARINLSAGAGRAGFSVGDRVRIEAAGMYAGEMAVIERLSSGVIPSAQVRTDSGGTRQVRTIDLRAEEPAADTAQAEKSHPEEAESASAEPDAATD